MKRFLIGIIKLYQQIPGSWHNNCRHQPTCSNYAVEAITYHGAFKGSMLTIWRLLRCNPFGTKGFDPVPRKKEKKNK